MRVRLGSLFALAFLLSAGCANPKYSNQRQDFSPSGWKTVAILPFSGDSRFADAATQSFAIHIMNVPDFRIVQPNTVSVSVRELGIATNTNGFTILEAQKVGRTVAADAVIVGSVTSYNNGATMNGFCTAQIIDVASGEIVGACHYPSGLIIGYSEHQGVMAATERAGKDVMKMLLNLSKKNHSLSLPLRKRDQTESKGQTNFPLELLQMSVLDSNLLQFRQF